MINRSSARIIAHCIVTILITIFSFSAKAIQPTSQQIEQFKRMSPAEQSGLAKQFGVEAPQGATNHAVVAIQETTVSPRTATESAVPTSPKASKALAGKSDLRPFGYDLFAGNPTSFTPVNDIPVSSDYLLGSGDSLKMNLYGKESLSFELAIDQEGMVYLPDLGPLSLAGLSFAEAKQQLISTIDQKMIGVKASVSMGQLRSIRVFVLGEAHLPGSYVVSSLSTITNALVLSGGVSISGSLRNIQLKRRGKLIKTLDLYDLLLKGDTSNDAQLKSGDVVFIPPVELTVSIQGEVRRPAIYEVIKGSSVKQLIALAGGLLSTAQPSLTKIQRIGSNDNKLLLDVDLTQASKSVEIQNGDNVNIPANLGILNGVVTVSGNVSRPGIQSWQKGVRISDVIDAAGISSNTDLEYALIKRYVSSNDELRIISFSLSEIIERPGSDKDLKLMEQDELILFGLYDSNRNQTIEGLINELRVHADVLLASQEVTVSGNVRYPGTYPLVENMQVEDLIRAAGGLSEKAFQLQAELSRTEFDAQQERKQYRVGLNLSQTDSLNFSLKSRDVLQIKTIPDWAELEQVTLSGEVKFPGVYPIYKNDTLALLLERAGGLTEFAYVPGAMFTRVSLKKQQAQQINEMHKRLAEDIAKAELVAANQGDDSEQTGDVAEAQKLLSKLENTTPTGRLVIDLRKILAKEADYSIPILKGDELFIPMKKNSVTIIGEVQLPISQVYETELDYRAYIERSGGTTDKADEGRVYIIKANGAVQMPESSGWFSGNDMHVAPGDTIVVPLDADKLDQVVLWRDMSQIFYQIALGAAAVGSL